MLGQTDPHFPILGIAQAGVERTGAQPRGPSDDDIGASTRNGIVSGERRHDLFRRERRAAIDESYQ